MMDLDLGLRRLHSLISEADKGFFSEFLIFEYRLIDILEEERKSGRTSESQARRIQVINELNDLALRVSDYTFNALCRPEFVRFRAGRAIHNLPHPDYGEFIGREQEVERLLRELRPHPAGLWPVIIIHGIGGSGKTTLAHELAWRLVRTYSSLPSADRFEAIIWLTAKEAVLTLAGIRARTHYFHSLQDVFIAIGQTLERPEISAAAPAQREALVREALGRQRTLLILDNLETIEADDIEAFVREPPMTTKVLITSRHNVTSLSGLTIELKGMTRAECEQLIDRERRRELNNEVVLSQQQTARLFELTEGIPLAIVWSIGLTRIGHEIDQVLGHLKQADNDLARFCFDYSVEAVHKDEHAYRLLMALSLFPGEASKVTLGLMTGLIQDQRALTEALSKLEQMSLIVRQGNRYNMLALARSYARAEMRRNPTFQETIQRWRLEQDQELRSIEDLWARAASAHDGADWDTLRSYYSELAHQISKPLGLIPVAEPAQQISEIARFVAECAKVSDSLLGFMWLDLLFVADVHQIDRLVEETEYWQRVRIAFGTLVLLIPLFHQQLLEEADLAVRRLRLTSGAHLAIFTYNDILTVIGSRHPARELRRMLIKRLDLIRLAPFVYLGPVPERMFFGRERELRTIVEVIEQRDSVVLGAHRSGKTSLLLRLRGILPSSGFQVVFLDCFAIRTADELFALSLDRQSPPQAPDIRLGELLEQVQADWRVVLLLDEVDWLISTDRADAWRVCRLLRDLSSSGRCRLVFSGGHMLRDMLRDASSPWFKGAEEIVLGSLDRRAAAELVTRTMRMLEIDLVDEAAVTGLLYDMTGGRACLLQQVCMRLLEDLPVGAERRITTAEVAAVMADPRQREALIDIYLRSAPPFEQLIALTMAANKTCRGAVAVGSAIARLGLVDNAVEIARALDHLIDLHFTLRRNGERYEFAFPFLERALESLPELHDLIDEARDQYIASRPTPYYIEDALPHDSPVYITRAADREILLHLRKMEYIVLRGPHKTGKTSMVKRLLHEMAGPAYRIAYLDCATLDIHHETAWYHSLFHHSSTVISPFLPAQPVLHNGASFQDLLIELGEQLERLNANFVMVLDKVEAIPVAWSDHFFSILRATYNARQLRPSLRRIAFLLVSSADPSDLIQDQAISPFNIAQIIWLKDLSLDQVAELAVFLPVSQALRGSIAERIFFWTSGQPYLTQRLCLHLSAETGLGPETVDVQVQRMLRDGISHLRNITTRLGEEPELLRFYQRVATGSLIRTGRFSKPPARLEALGVIKEALGRWAIGNRIYEAALAGLLENLSLQDKVARYLATFTEEGLNIFCFAHGIHYSELPGKATQDRIAALVRLLDERGLLAGLSQHISAMEIPTPEPPTNEAA